MKLSKQDMDPSIRLETATLEGKNKILGFWLFLAAETVLFSCLFGTYLALRTHANGGPTTQELFQLPLVAIATFILLTSSLTSVLGIVAMHKHDVNRCFNWLFVTVLFGLSFLGLEIYEFAHYIHEGLTMSTSAFGSSFYTLVGTHGSHVLFGSIWISFILIQLKSRGLNTDTAPKVYVASLYWHFVDVVWVFIFTLVYLLGTLE
ncbi:cytochrome (ubi)quinol oxidase subunit III [Mechercharimyces sp. CAU 1602]|uniref:cytochrome (ubi)quinol oxidase subunit III n=1 Tax=Mechercharimyces sp. CAU 1602 TaxID=2973933 RepID=UPI00216271AD|nr:cytochrome (ubi)quinol oxidase subunit III [Mechercharimyces sp. CAU 1602]MCS1352763.1 cytochrome (ubi)quinol oxidase subunit III [Mechercharimyces sp. CAU 1602]